MISKESSRAVRSEHVQAPRVIAHRLGDDGLIPNNPKLPLLIYQGPLKLPKERPAEMVEELLRANHWGGSWRDSIYPYHHYHSTAHEVLAVLGGSAKVQLGGGERADTYDQRW